MKKQIIMFTAAILTTSSLWAMDADQGNRDPMSEHLDACDAFRALLEPGKGTHEERMNAARKALALKPPGRESAYETELVNFLAPDSILPHLEACDAFRASLKPCHGDHKTRTAAALKALTLLPQNTTSAYEGELHDYLSPNSMTAFSITFDDYCALTNAGFPAAKRKAKLQEARNLLPQSAARFYGEQIDEEMELYK